MEMGIKPPPALPILSAFQISLNCRLQVLEEHNILWPCAPVRLSIRGVQVGPVPAGPAPSDGQRVLHMMHQPGCRPRFDVELIRLIKVLLAFF